MTSIFGVPVTTVASLKFAVKFRFCAGPNVPLGVVTELIVGPVLSIVMGVVAGEFAAGPFMSVEVP